MKKTKLIIALLLFTVTTATLRGHTSIFGGDKRHNTTEMKIKKHQLLREHGLPIMQ
ncbi:hypothetical protein [Hydrotalea sp. AMD]|uniref:hypothetical protein n=1 Tax=Hydrotalea sp. AMD TaxID=2501297 RepID=UPI00159F0A79|nr:hypothetical protein [Hydrotalea sp. AMD]